MKRNVLSYSLALCLIVIFMLGVLSAVPEFKAGGWRFKKIDLLSGIRQAEQKEVALEIAFPELDSVQVAIDSVAEEIQSGCPKGITCIEDYSSDTTGLQHFLAALSNLKKSKTRVRIAFYGDSFIEGDVFCGSVRDTLQTLFGGRGVGFVPITSSVTGFRNTIKHNFHNWETHSLITPRDSTGKVQIGPAGYCFIPQTDNWVKYKVSRQRYLREFFNMRLYYKNRGHAILHYTINDTLKGSTPLQRSAKLREWKIENRKTRTIEYQFEQHDSLQVYGASFEFGAGIYVDNFALRGNSGVGLYNISNAMFKEFNRYRDYKLILLQYGLNVVNPDSARYSWYAARMTRVIKKMKYAFPNASIILVGVSDRSSNVDGELKTPATIPALRNTQRYIAKQTGIVFWDLYEAMGGENSMVKFVQAKPALAAKDYTHLTFKGGRKLASHLVKSMLFELAQYEKRTAQP